MLVNAEFRRDMQQNLLVLKDQEMSIGGFQEKMLENNSLEGFLPIRIQHMNGERMIFYDLYGIQPLSEVCRMTLPNASQLTVLVQGILQAIRITGEYLLKEDDILLSLEYMFVRLPEYQVKLCYYPGYQVSIKKQLSQLFEALMSCVDYEDRDAVYLMYSLYMKSKDDSCTVLDLEQLLHPEEKLKIGSASRTKLTSDTEIRDYVHQESQDYKLNESQNQAHKANQVYKENQAHIENQVQIQNNPQIQKQTNKQPGQQRSLLQPNSQAHLQQVTSNPKKEHYLNQEIPLAMSTSVMPPELGIGQPVIQSKIIAQEARTNTHKSFRPLISNHREEEKEVWFYPSSCYLLGGLVIIATVLVFGIILMSNILYDPVLKKVEPIKLIAALCIVILPAFYGIKLIFNPEKKMSKFVSVGQYDLKEIAVTKEAMEGEVPKSKASLHRANTSLQKDNTSLQKANTSLQRTNTGLQRANTGLQRVSSWDGENRLVSEMQIHSEEQIQFEEQIQTENHTQTDDQIQTEVQIQTDDQTNVGENRTMLLNGVQASPFAQLISEHPEKAGTITLVECPFYIGTVKNQMNYSLSCPVISRYHAKIEKQNGIYYIIDLNSTNGTFVNGRRLIADEPNVLIAGDKVSFANICFIFACPNQKFEI